MEAVERHRANEGGFRFETSAQLKEVEDERIRLEKERRVSAFSLFDRLHAWKIVGEKKVECCCFRAYTARVGATLRDRKCAPREYPPSP